MADDKAQTYRHNQREDEKLSEKHHQAVSGGRLPALS